LVNLKKRILLKNENLTNINKTSTKFSNARLKYNIEYLNMTEESDEGSKTSQSESSSESEEEIPDAFKSNKSTHSLSLHSARNPKTSEFLDLDGTSVRDIMENFGMSK
jgi:hypothetical protein